jgi:hypothetical protein
MNFGWYKPGISQQEFAEDKYECMSKSQMEASGAYVNAYGGAASSQTTTNMPLFQACMQARGYVWTNQAEVEKYEAAQQPAPAYSSSSTSHPPASRTDRGSEHSHTDAEIAQARQDAFKGCLASGRDSTICQENADQVARLMRRGVL